MSESDRKPPAFFCPSCGQKHRAALAPLQKRGAEGLAATCRNCGAKLKVRLDAGTPLAELVEPAVSPAPPPTPDPRHVEPGGPYEENLAAPLEKGAKAGRYIVKRMLSQGRTSVVYEVNDPTTKRSVALKVLRSGASDLVRELFLRQVEAQANIRHPNIMPVYDRGALEDGRPYFTAELLAQPAALVDVLERREQGTLRHDRALQPLVDLRELVAGILVPVADGVYVANIENGVVHGDLRPENVLIDRRTRRPYVTDFGCSHELVEGRAKSAAPLSAYVSPEQARGWVYPRTDVWGLGALLLACMTGRPPIEGRGDELRQHALSGLYASPPPDAPPALVAIARKAMASDPDTRYVNARQMATDLRTWLKGGTVRAVEEFGSPDAAAQVTRKQVKQHLRSAAWVAGGLLVGLLIGSQIKLGGEDPGDVLVSHLQTDVNDFDQALTKITDQMAHLAPNDAAHAWETLDRRTGDLAGRLAKAPPSVGRDSVEAQIRFVRERFAPVPVVIKAPAGVAIEATNTTTGRTFALTLDAKGEAPLPPGYYEIRIGEGARSAILPARTPLVLRQKGQAKDVRPPCTRWVVPVDPATIPETRALVAGCRVHLEGPPQTVRGEGIDVPTFAIDKRPVTNDQYASFLGALVPDQRKAHAPSVGFEEVHGMWRPTARVRYDPVRGVREEDAVAYAAWRSKQEGVTLRLPTLAERRRATGASLADRAAGDLAVRPEQNPFGIVAIDSPEIVSGTETDADLGFRLVQELTRAGD